MAEGGIGIETPQATHKKPDKATDGQSAPAIVVPDGKFASPNERFFDKLRRLLRPNKSGYEQNFHNVSTREFTINGQQRNIELVHQIREGDCIPANFLNTASVEFDGHLPASIKEARNFAIRKRQEQGKDISDIVLPDSPLDYGDVVNLFSTLYGQPPTQEDVLTVEGRNKSNIDLQMDSLNILEYLDTYKSGLCTTGLGRHSRTIKKLAGDNYAIIDPMNENGIEFKNTDQMVGFLSGYMANQRENENFFFFIRNEHEKNPIVVPEGQFNGRPNEQIRTLELRQQVEKAMEAALPEKEVLARANQDDNLVNQFLQGNITHANYEELSKPLQHAESTIRVSTSEEFSMLLRMIPGLKAEDIERTVEHELHHFEEYRRQGLTPQLQVQLTKTEDGGIGVLPSTYSEVPPDWTDEKIAAVRRKTIAAPSDLSSSDRRQLGLPEDMKQRMKALIKRWARPLLEPYSRWKKQ
jgi:hypothetical protein